MRFKNQIDKHFLIDGDKFIYMGARTEEYSGTECNRCGKEIQGEVHWFNSLYGYEIGNYESRFYGSECVKMILEQEEIPC